MTLSIFKNPAKEEAKNYVSHLIRMAAADEEIHSKEIQFIKKVGAEKGLKEKEVSNLLNSGIKSATSYPENKTERFDLLYDVANLMFADGKVDDKEFDFCVDLASKMGFNSKVVDLLIAKIERALQINEPMNRLKEEANALIEY